MPKTSASKPFEQQVAIAYGDRTMLDEELKKLFPGESFQVKIKLGFFHLQIPRELTREEIDGINERIRFHYQEQHEEY